MSDCVMGISKTNPEDVIHKCVIFIMFYHLLKYQLKVSVEHILHSETLPEQSSQWLVIIGDIQSTIIQLTLSS